MTSTKSLQIELVTKYDTKEGGEGWESKSAKRGSISAGRFESGSSKSAVTTGRSIESFEVLPAIQRNPRLKVKFVSFWSQNIGMF